MRSLIGLILVTIAVANVPSVYAQSYTGKVVQTVVTDNLWGSCMVKMDTASVGGTCGPWVSFACDGSQGGKDIAYRKYDSAAMALALGWQVQIFYNQSIKINGQCYSPRIDVLAPAP